MNMNPSSKKGDHDKERTVSDGVQESIYPFQHETNIADGGEFLDDGIRMKEQPFGQTTVEKDE